jgi:hypothetical protein
MEQVESRFLRKLSTVNAQKPFWILKLPHSTAEVLLQQPQESPVGKLTFNSSFEVLFLKSL